jgi:predicted lipoprotein with Yx(FWY)xxD motif
MKIIAGFFYQKYIQFISYYVYLFSSSHSNRRKNIMKSRNYSKSILKSVSFAGVLVSISILLAACIPSGQANQPEQVTTAAITQPVAVVEEAVINVTTDPTLGQILVDGKGMTLYMFTVDEPDKSNCDADCLAKWPPLLTQGSPKLGSGVDASLVGSAALSDGTRIVTYNKMPLLLGQRYQGW